MSDEWEEVMSWKGLLFTAVVVLATIQAALFTTSLWAAQSIKGAPTVLVKEVRFEGDFGLPVTDLQQYTEYLTGHPVERAKILKEASYAVGKVLQHRGYLKEQVTPRIRPFEHAAESKDGEVILELTISAGRQYRIKDMSFSGLSTEVRRTDLTQAFDIHPGDIADAEKIGIGIANLQALFRRKGKDVAVLPDVIFDDAVSAVSFRFDIRE